MDMMKIREVWDRHRLLFSIVIVTVLLALTWISIPITFETNDDMFLMSCLSGGRTGKPEADTIFSMFLWGKLVSSLYNASMMIPWYTLIFLSLIALSLVTVCYCVMASFPKWGGSLFCLMFFCLFLYYSVIIQYTTVSAYCGVAVVSLMMIERKEENRKNIIIKNIIIFSFMLFTVNIRCRVGYLVIGSAACAICLEVLRYLLKVADKRKIKNMAISFITICVATGISIGVNNIHESLGGWEDFREYNAQRVPFTDYSKLEYESNKDLFDEIGWSEDFYELVKRWFFMDEAVNAETLGRINERNVHGSIRVGRSLLHDWFPKIEFQVIVWVLLLIFLFADSVRHRGGRYKRSIVSFVWLFVWFVETQYFGYIGRVIERAFEAWTLLAVIPSILGMAGDYSAAEEEVEEKKKRITGSGIIPVLALLFCIICVRHPSGGYVRAKAVALSRSEARITWTNIEDYAVKHSGNIYIYGMSLPREGDPWRVYTEGVPYNLLFWGGSFYHSPIYYTQIRMNGFEHIFEEDFFEENVYFIAQEEPDENLRSVMEEKFPGCTCVIIDEEESFIVYKYLKSKI